MAPRPEFLRNHEIRCKRCGFQYFHNTAAAVGIILEHQGKYLFLRRGHNPQKGKIDVPGGFVDPGETLETALVRELREEIAAEIGPTVFVTSFSNTYSFANVTYTTCDCYFTARLLTDPDKLIPAEGEISEICWLRPSEVDEEEIAFPSLKNMWNLIKRS